MPTRRRRHRRAPRAILCPQVMLGLADRRIRAPDGALYCEGLLGPGEGEIGLFRLYLHCCAICMFLFFFSLCLTSGQRLLGCGGAVEGCCLLAHAPGRPAARECPTGRPTRRCSRGRAGQYHRS